MKKLLPALLLSLLAGVAARADTIVTFSAGAEGWTGPAGIGGVTTIEPAGGNPGANMRTVFSDFGITFRNDTTPDFLGDYTRFASATLRIDLKVESIDFFGSPVSRPWLVELRDLDDPPVGYPYVSVWYKFADVAAATHGGWTPFSVTIEDTLATELPAGWGGTGAEDAQTFEPILPPDRTFTSVLQGVDEIVFTTFEPGFFFGETAHDLRIDNVGILTADAIPGEVPALWLDKASPAASSLTLSWEPSCGTAATDYGIYEGVMGDWASHTRIDCSDAGGDRTETVTPGSGDRYYLVVPLEPTAEGSYGAGSDGDPRPRGAVKCRFAQDAGSCDPGPAGCDRQPAPGEDGKIGIVRDYVNAQYGPGMAGIAIVNQGSLVATTGTGGADGETIFWIASTSKLVTSVGAVALMGEGSLDSSAPVTGYVTDFTENNGLQDQILIEHLLQNRSGLPQDGGCAGFACRQELPGNATTVQYDLMVPDRGATLGNVFTPDMLQMIPYSVFNVTSFTPGSGYQYAGWGWMLAGRAMELASGETFDRLMQERVLDPAGMCRATYDGATVDSNAALGTGTNAIDGFCLEPMLPPGHQGEGEPYYHDELDCAVRMPQGGLHASALDMGRLAETLLQDLAGAGNVTDAASMRRLFCPDGGSGVPGAAGSTCLGRGQVTGSQAVDFGPDYGFGNFRRSYSFGGTTYDLYNHGGGRAGFSSYFALVPEAGFAISVLTNGSGSAGWHDVAECAIRVYLHGATGC